MKGWGPGESLLCCFAEGVIFTKRRKVSNTPDFREWHPPFSLPVSDRIPPLLTSPNCGPDHVLVLTGHSNPFLWGHPCHTDVLDTPQRNTPCTHGCLAIDEESCSPLHYVSHVYGRRRTHGRMASLVCADVHTHTHGRVVSYRSSPVGSPVHGEGFRH